MNKYIVKIENNKVTPYVKDGIYEIKKQKKTRSNLQNAYLWGAVYEIIQQVQDFEGWTKSDIHFYFRNMLLKREKIIKIPTNEGVKTETIDYLISTQSLTTSQFEDFLHEVRFYMRKHGVVIPKPNETEFSYE